MVRVSVDEELGREGFTYELESGRQGTVHVEQVLEYNQDPSQLRDQLLYRFDSRGPAQSRRESAVQAGDRAKAPYVGLSALPPSRPNELRQVRRSDSRAAQSSRLRRRRGHPLAIGIVGTPPRRPRPLQLPVSAETARLASVSAGLPTAPPERGKHFEVWVGLFVIAGVFSIVVALFLLTDPAAGAVKTVDSTRTVPCRPRCLEPAAGVVKSGGNRRAICLSTRTLANTRWRPTLSPPTSPFQHPLLPSSRQLH